MSLQLELGGELLITSCRKYFNEEKDGDVLYIVSTFNFAFERSLPSVSVLVLFQFAGA